MGLSTSFAEGEGGGVSSRFYTDVGAWRIISRTLSSISGSSARARQTSEGIIQRRYWTRRVTVLVNGYRSNITHIQYFLNSITSTQRCFGRTVARNDTVAVICGDADVNVRLRRGV